MALIYCINIKSPSSLNGLEKYIFKYLYLIHTDTSHLGFIVDKKYIIINNYNNYYNTYVRTRMQTHARMHSVDSYISTCYIVNSERAWTPEDSVSWSLFRINFVQSDESLCKHGSRAPQSRQADKTYQYRYPAI